MKLASSPREAYIVSYYNNSIRDLAVPQVVGLFLAEVVVAAFARAAQYLWMLRAVRGMPAAA